MDLHVEMERLRRDNAQLQKTVSLLEHRVQELSVESEDLREICAAKGISVKDAVAARQHRRMFARALTEYPTGASGTASDVFNLLEISPPHSLSHAETRPQLKGGDTAPPVYLCTQI